MAGLRLTKILLHLCVTLLCLWPRTTYPQPPTSHRINPETTGNYIAETANPSTLHVGHCKLHGSILSLNISPPKSRLSSKLQSRQSTSSSATLLTLLLLSCGDIHPCPGPVFKYPCGKCAKPVKRNQRGIACDICDHWFHCKCIDMDLPTYRRLSDESTEWYCDYCHIQHLPSFSDSFFNTNEDPLSTSTLDDPISEPVSPRRAATIQGQSTLKESKGFKIAHINTGNGGLLYHLPEITRVLDIYSLDVLAISETWLYPDIDNDNVKIEGYEFVRHDNNGKFTGQQGVGLYIKDSIPHNPRPDLDSPLLMTRTVEMNRPHCRPLLVTALYRHPKSSANFYTNMESQLIKLDSTKHSSIILGDFNIDYTHLHENSSNAKTLNRLANDYGFDQTIKAYTRITDSTATTIDLCLTNLPNQSYVSGVAAVSVADHLMNFITLPKRTGSNKHRYITSRNFKRLDANVLCAELDKLPWNVVDIFDDINDSWDTWKLLFNSVIDSLCPMKTFRPRKKVCPWHSEEIDSLKLVRDQYRNRAILTNNPDDWARWKKCKNAITTICRKAKADYFKTSIEENKGDSRALWRTLRTVLPKCKSNGIQALDINGHTVTDFAEIANHFNYFFTSIGERLAEAIPRTTTTALQHLRNYIPRAKTTFSFERVETEFVTKLLRSLPENKATGLDNYQAKLLKLSAGSIAPSMTRLINKSLTSGQFPADWKRAKISAIFKKGSKTDASNYRPISILPVISKIIEKIVHHQLYEYLSEHGLLTAAQSGFRKGYSTQTSLHRLTESVFHALNQAKVVGMIALDLRKAFDTVNHRVLLDKLEHYGVRNSSLDWFKDYLRDRTQISCINDSKSSVNHIRTGVPQGSILGPLLFIVYVNDLPGCIKTCDVNMYADDTAFYSADKDIRQVSMNLNSDTKNVFDWLCANKLSLHIGKTNSILICNYQKIRHLETQNLDITLDSDPIEQVDHLKYLGVDIDARCNFDVYISNLVKKLNKSIGVLKRCANFLPLKTRMTLYNCLILPHIDYCSTTWSCTSQSNLARLQRLQNRSMRVILNAPPRTHIEDMLSQLKWMSIKQRLFYNSMVLMWRIVHGCAPSYLTEHLRFANEQHHHNTTSASRHNIHIPHGHRNSLFTNGALQWNSLPDSLRRTETLQAFKRQLSKYTLSNCTQF